MDSTVTLAFYLREYPIL